jgi:hypothetical protein
MNFPGCVRFAAIVIAATVCSRRINLRDFCRIWHRNEIIARSRLAMNGGHRPTSIVSLRFQDGRGKQEECRAHVHSTDDEIIMSNRCSLN